METTLIIVGVLGILYAIIALVLGNSQNEETGKPYRLPGSRIIGLISAMILVTIMLIVRIEAQEVGIVVTPSGVQSQPLQTGWHVVMPWVEVYRMDKTMWVYTFTHSTQEGAKKNEDAIWAPTKDGIKIGFDISISWHIDGESAPWIYSNIADADGGEDDRYTWISENIIRAKTKSLLSLTVSDYTPIEAYSTKRSDIEKKVEERMREELKKIHVILDQVDIREVYYNKEYESSINNKKLAEQEVLRLIEVTKQKEEKLKQAHIEKDIAIQQAQGEAEALRIKGASIVQNPKIIDLQWIEKWDGQLPTYMLGGGSNTMMMIK